MHHVLVRHIGVSEDYLADIILLNKLCKLRFRGDRDASGVKPAGQLPWVAAPFDIWDLRGRKCHDLIAIVIAEIGVEVVEVAPRSTHDNSPNLLHRSQLLSAIGLSGDGGPEY